MALTSAKCAHCEKQLGYHYDLPIEYPGKHWHISCLLDTLTQGARLADNPLSPLHGGSGFHP